MINDSKSKLHYAVRSIYHILRFVRKEIRAKSSLPLTERLRWFSRGFSANEAQRYNFTRYDPKLYVTDLQFQLKTGRFNGEYRHFLHDKLAFHGLMEPAAHARPRLYALVHRGRVRFSQRSDSEALEQHLRAGGRIVIKPIRGGGGKSVQVWRWANPSVDPIEALAHDVEGLGESVVVAFVEQAAYAKRIFDGATNTVRMLTLWDDDADRPFLAVAVHRFGSELSKPCDNLSRGGLSALIDTDSGVIGSAAMVSQSGSCKAEMLKWVDLHPDSNMPICGVVIPGWQTVVAGLLVIAANYPYLPYVGWDVVVKDSGFCIIEGNSTPAVWLTQIHKPLLTDARVRAFFERRGVR